MNKHPTQQMGLNWDNLTKEERVVYMFFQMSPRAYYSGYMPDDCGFCGACGQPVVGGGLCRDCYHQWKELHNKLTNKGG